MRFDSSVALVGLSSVSQIVSLVYSLSVMMSWISRLYGAGN